MLYDNEIATIELRRLNELEKQAALHGPNTEPAVLVEIQTLRHKYETPPHGRFVRAPGSRDKALDYDFLMNTVSSALMRVAGIENDNKDRPRRQLVLNIWLGAISAGMLLNLGLTLWLINRLFGL